MKHLQSLFYLIVSVSIVLSACYSESPVAVESTPIFLTSEFSGGETTVFDASSHAFSTPAPNLSPAAFEKHLEGDVEFEANFVTAPAEVNPGLGPIYNNISCINCHSRDGRGRPPTVDEKFVSMLFRPQPSEACRCGGWATSHPRTPDSVHNLTTGPFSEQTRRVKIKIDYTEQTLTTADGTRVHLRYPNYTFTETYQPLPEEVEVSPRVAPVVFGLGLLEAIPEETILAYADEADVDGDASRANRITYGMLLRSVTRWGVSDGRRTNQHCCNRLQRRITTIWV